MTRTIIVNITELAQSALRNWDATYMTQKQVRTLHRMVEDPDEWADNYDGTVQVEIGPVYRDQWDWLYDVSQSSED